MNPFPLLSPRQIGRVHWRSIPDARRLFSRLLTYAAALIAAAPVVLGWANLNDAGTAALAAAAAAIAALLFGFGLQVFGMAAEVRRPQDHPERAQMIDEAERLRGLLANVLYCTLWSGGSALAVGISAFVGWLWVERTLLAAGVAAFVVAFVAFMLTIRRLFDEAQMRLDRAYETPVDRSKRTRTGP